MGSRHKQQASPVHNLLDNAGARVLAEAQSDAQQQYMQAQHLAPHHRSLAVVILSWQITCAVPFPLIKSAPDMYRMAEKGGATDILRG